jgi:hypothetical protein
VIPWQASDEDDGHHIAPLRQSRSVGHRHPPLSLAPHDVPSLALVACLGLTQIQLGGERERSGHRRGAPRRSREQPRRAHAPTRGSSMTTIGESGEGGS